MRFFLLKKESNNFKIILIRNYINLLKRGLASMLGTEQISDSRKDIHR